MAVWLLTPWITRRIFLKDGTYKIATLPLWLGVVAGAVVLVAALLTEYGDVSRNIASFDSGQEKLYGQPDEDWRVYGRNQFGQRFSPLKQITPDKVKQLRVAWSSRTGDRQGPNDSIETTFEVTPIKVGNTIFLCSQHQ
jgi:quinoprotein glucose dehydrogenase